MAAAKPILIYDGKCGFCRIWIDYWKQLTGDRIEYRASQEVGDRFPQIPSEAYPESVQLVREDGSVVSGARAVFESLDALRLYRWMSLPAELVYRFIAKHRNWFYHLTRWTFGSHIEPARFAATQWLFLRVLALIYAIAFGSLATQAMGLYGSQGILPAAEFFQAVERSGGAIRYVAVPSIFWLASDDLTLQAMCWAGVVLAVLLLITGFQRGRFERLILILLFALYLSFAAMGQEFLSFQWDSLLLEAGFLAIFLGSGKIIPWMFRWLAFRLFFLSGAVKLLSGDPTWRNLTAMNYHYLTQPLPTPLAWYAAKLPEAVQRASAVGVFAIELVLPFFIFLPRRLRQVAACCMIGLQVLIMLTGNYAFFNLLTIAICFFLFDDRTWGKWIGESRLGVFTVMRRTPRWVTVVAALLFLLGLGRLYQTFAGSVPDPVSAAIRYTAPLQIVNTYGLFAVMTTVRNEIVIEGSADGENWKPYEFRYKPGDPRRAPRWVAPHQPRLDWQMWFAALGNYQSNSWIVNLAVRLLEGSPAVTALLANNPFEHAPPKFIRAMLFEYTFSSAAEKTSSGDWWKREPRGPYLPAVGLRSATPSAEK